MLAIQTSEDILPYKEVANLICKIIRVGIVILGQKRNSIMHILCYRLLLKDIFDVLKARFRTEEDIFMFFTDSSFYYFIFLEGVLIHLYRLISRYSSCYTDMHDSLQRTTTKYVSVRTGTLSTYYRTNSSTRASSKH